MKSQVQIDAIVNGIISYLEDNQALDLLPLIAQELIKQSWVKIDPNLAVVYSAITLNAKQQANIKTHLSKILKRPIRLKTQVDKSIIAGLKIEVAGQVIDGTLNRQLQDLKQQIVYD